MKGSATNTTQPIKNQSEQSESCQAGKEIIQQSLCQTRELALATPHVPDIAKPPCPDHGQGMLWIDRAGLVTGSESWLSVWDGDPCGAVGSSGEQSGMVAIVGNS